MKGYFFEDVIETFAVCSTNYLNNREHIICKKPGRMLGCFLLSTLSVLIVLNLPAFFLMTVRSYNMLSIFYANYFVVQFSLAAISR